VIAGDGIVAATLPGHQYEAKPHADLPAKVPGEHRWIAAGSWVLSSADVEHADDADRLKFLDHENLLYLAIGCWDCEQPLGAIEYGSRCPAGAT
jgi:hypothetical protein